MCYLPYLFATIVFLFIYANCTNTTAEKTQTSAQNTSIINAAGKTIFTKTLTDVEKGITQKILLQSFAKGIYFIKISCGTQSQTEKIVIE